MKQDIKNRLNQIPDKILSEDFIYGRGLGNEVNFWIFDYDPVVELEVRAYIKFLVDMVEKKHSTINLVHINLLEAMVTYLSDRGFVDKAIQLQEKKGDDALIKALLGPLHMDKFAPYIKSLIKQQDNTIVFISGVGSAWPLLRAHNMLHSLHALLGDMPLVLFYPGHYDGQSMKLFGKISSDNYYRAFKLIPE